MNETVNAIQQVIYTFYIVNWAIRRVSQQTWFGVALAFIFDKTSSCRMLLLLPIYWNVSLPITTTEFVCFITSSYNRLQLHCYTVTNRFNSLFDFIKYKKKLLHECRYTIYVFLKEKVTFWHARKLVSSPSIAQSHQDHPKRKKLNFIHSGIKNNYEVVPMSFVNK